MKERIAFLWPEIAMFLGTCAVMVVGLSPSQVVRKLASVVCGLTLAVAAVLAITTTPVHIDASGGQLLLPAIVTYAKVIIAAVGLLLLMVVAGTVDRQEDREINAGRRKFSALRSNHAEFYSFFLFSLTGAMLCASADDLIWLFLALELTSLPTYIMVTISRPVTGAKWTSPEAGVKYFFLGALGAAIFLYGFALIYGGTGTTNFNQIAAIISTGGLNTITLAGLMLALIGVCFKIAAVPMHFYTPDVYQGAASPVTAFLAFVPKTAGFIAIVLLCSLVGWNWGGAEVGEGASKAIIAGAGDGASLPEPLRVMLWVVAAMTMTVGNVLALLQSSVKRTLAYSSIAHSGYMLVGVIVGPAATGSNSGLAAVFFYLLAYGVMNTGAFAVLASLERADGREVDSFSDLRGLWKRRPVLAGVLIICSLSLLGFPPLLGFMGKLPLFTSAISAGEIVLVVVLGMNSAIAAFYYLKIVGVTLFEPADGANDAAAGELIEMPSRRYAAIIAGAAVVLLVVVAQPIFAAAARATSTGDAHADHSGHEHAKSE